MTVTTDEASSTPWLSVDEQRYWRAFLGGTTVLMDQLDRDLRAKHGLSMPEYEILVRLSESEDRSIRMAELADALAHSRSRITHTVARLERAGIVKRSQASTDGRGVTTSLTDHGFSVLEAAAHTHVRGVNDYLVSLASKEEFEILGTILGRVREQLGGRSF